MRVRDSLFTTNQKLQLEPYMTFDAGIRAVQVSPDHRLLVVETNAPPKLDPVTPDQTFLGGPPVKVRVFALGEKKPLAESTAKVPTLMPLMGDGLLDLLEGRTQGSWVMRDVPFEGQPQTVAEVRSSCQPSARPLSATVVLMVGCSGEADDRQVIAVSTRDGELWRYRWQNRFVWGWFDSAENGSRFVYESVQVNRRDFDVRLAVSGGCAGADGGRVRHGDREAGAGAGRVAGLDGGAECGAVAGREKVCDTAERGD